MRCGVKLQFCLTLNVFVSEVRTCPSDLNDFASDILVTPVPAGFGKPDRELT